MYLKMKETGWSGGFVMIGVMWLYDGLMMAIHDDYDDYDGCDCGWW